MNLSLILNPDCLPKLSIPIDVASTSPEKGRHVFDSCAAEIQLPTSFGQPIFTPSLQASLKLILDEPPPSPSRGTHSPSVSQGHERALTVQTSPPKPESSRQRSTTGSRELARQRSIQGTKLITSYFSPSQSPKKTANSPQSSTFTSANAPQQLELSTLLGTTSIQEVSHSAKRLLPAFLNDVRYESPEKRRRLEDPVFHSTEIKFQDSSDLDAMLIDDNEPQDAVQLIATPVENISDLSLQSAEEVSSILKDKLPIPALLSPFTKPDDYESQVEVMDDTFLSDDDDAQGFSSASESFDKYDPYFDTFEVRPAVTLLMIDPKAKTSSSYCRWKDCQTDTYFALPNVGELQPSSAVPALRTDDI